MLFSYRKGVCALAAALALSAGAAGADGSYYEDDDHKIHLVTIVDGGYFPDVTYIREGDKIRFHNESAGTHTVGASDGSWTSGQLGVDEQFMLNVDETTPLTFAGVSFDGLEVEGAISYDPPPLGFSTLGSDGSDGSGGDNPTASQ